MTLSNRRFSAVNAANFALTSRMAVPKYLRSVKFWAYAVTLGVIAFAASILAVWIDERFDTLDGQRSCPVVDFSTLPSNALVFRRDTSSFWQWRYKVATPGMTGTLEQHCPSSTHEPDLYLNGLPAGIVSGSISTTKRTKTSIKDCHGDTIFTSHTGPSWTQNVNANSLRVVYTIERAGVIVAYVDGTPGKYNPAAFSLLDAATNNPVATLTWSQPDTGGWTWRVQVANNMFSHPAANAVLLSLLAGQRMWSSASGTDLCNQYFATLGWVLVAVAILVFIGAAYWLYLRYCDRVIKFYCPEWAKRREEAREKARKEKEEEEERSGAEDKDKDKGKGKAEEERHNPKEAPAGRAKEIELVVTHKDEAKHEVKPANAASAPSRQGKPAAGAKPSKPPLRFDERGNPLPPRPEHAAAARNFFSAV